MMVSDELMGKKKGPAPKKSKSGPTHIPEVDDADTASEDQSLTKETETSYRPNRCQVWVEKTQKSIVRFCQRRKRILRIIFYALLGAAYHSYFVAAIVISGKAAVGLIVITIIVWLLMLYYYVYVPNFKGKVRRRVLCPALKGWKKLLTRKYVKLSFYLVVILAIAIFIIYDTREEPHKLMSLVGLVVFLIIGFLCSSNTARIHYRPVVAGLFMQFCLALLVFRWPPGLDAFKFVSDATVKFLDHTYAGTRFVFGFVADPPNICGLSPALIFTVFQVIIFFGAVVNVLYYYGVIQWLLFRIAWIVHHFLGTTAVESVYAVASTMLGMSEAPLIIKPYLIKLTESEIHQILVSGYASIAGSLFAAYIAFGACAQYLFAASIMSMPMGLCTSKLFFPETERSRTKHLHDLILPKGEERTVVEAISNGAYGVVAVVAIVGANLVVFFAAIEFMNNVIGWLGSMVGVEELTLELIYSYLFFPLAFLMGTSDNPDWNIRMAETQRVAELLGTKAVLNEFVAYKKMGDYIREGKLGVRAQMIATYALCGYSNIAAIGIQIGGLTGLCPEKKHIVPKLAVRALVAGSVSNFMTACFAGLLSSKPITCTPTPQRSDCLNLTFLYQCCSRDDIPENLTSNFTPFGGQFYSDIQGFY